MHSPTRDPHTRLLLILDAAAHRASLFRRATRGAFAAGVRAVVLLRGVQVDSRLSTLHGIASRFHILPRSTLTIDEAQRADDVGVPFVRRGCDDALSARLAARNVENGVWGRAAPDDGVDCEQSCALGRNSTLCCPGADGSLS